jgi:hypothetical protein
MNKKTFTKILALTVSVFILLSLFCSFCSATGERDESEIVGIENEVQGPSDDNGEERESAFALCFDYLSRYAGEIFSALAFISSILIVFLYKKGLIPIVNKSLRAIGGAVSSMKNAVEKNGTDSKELSTRLTEILDTTGNAIDRLTDNLELAGERLSALEESANDKEKLMLVLEGQCDLLYDVFMSSSLPQYKKDEIGERVKRMREAIMGAHGQ